MNTDYVPRRLAVAAVLVAAISGIVAAQVEPGLASTVAQPSVPAVAPAYDRLPQLPGIVVTARRMGE